MDIRRTLVGFATAFIVFTLAGCGSSSDSSPPPNVPPPILPPPVAAVLPLLAIDTENGVEILNRENYINATARLTDESGQTLLDGTTLQIRGRGNSTWNYPKKPYRLRFTTRTEVLGMPANRHWVLLANYLDKSLLRNELAFEFSERVGLAWTPRSVQVVLELNGEYQGIYQLTEHVRVDTDRVNIPQLNAADGLDAELVTGGYLMEVDQRLGEDYCPITPQGVSLCFGDPDTLLQPGWEAHKAYIDDYIHATEVSIYGLDPGHPDTGYAAYIDVDSAVDFYLVHELFKNVDSNFFSSLFLYKQRGGPIYFGPVWDFDLAAGNAQFFGAGTPTGWHTRLDTRGANWFTRLFDDPGFDQRVRERWMELQSTGVIEGLFLFIDRREAWLSQVQEQNFELWDILHTVIPAPGEGLSPVLGPWEEHVGALRSWLTERVAWMDAEFHP